MPDTPLPPKSPRAWPFWVPAFQWLFEIVWALLCSWTPKPLNFWRLLVARLFGCHIRGYPFIHSRARLTHPWNITLHHRACIGDRAHLYALGTITVYKGATIAQESYLCAGSHNFSDATLPLVTSPIVIGQQAFVAARAFILPGVTIGPKAVVGACSVVTKEVYPDTIVAGNPAAPLSKNV